MAAFQHARTIDSPKAGQWEVTGVLRMSSERAILLDDGATVAWLPKAKVIVDPLPGGRVAVTMPGWLKADKGFV